MSEARVLDEEGGGAEDQADLEARARRHGWKPQNEYRGPEGGWRDAATFLRRGEEELPIARERNRVLEQRLQASERAREEERRVLLDLSERTRKAEERGYAKARQELERQRLEAVQLGDTERFKETERELQALEADKPKPPATVDTTPVAQRGAAPAAGAPVPPEVVAWGQRNAWFMQHPDLSQKATRLHISLQATEPELSLAENLERVTELMTDMYPDLVAGRARRAAQPAAEQDDGAGASGREEEAPEPRSRRAAPAAVMPSREGGERRPGPRSFEAMPKDSKEQFARYAKALEGKEMGKGKPLTKEEWAASYWEQFD